MCVVYTLCVYSILYYIVYPPPCSTLCLPTLKYLFHLHICLCLNDILQKYNTKYIDRQIDCVILYLSYVYRTHINICMCETFSEFRIESTIIFPKYIYAHTQNVYKQRRMKMKEKRNNMKKSFSIASGVSRGNSLGIRYSAYSESCVV